MSDIFSDSKALIEKSEIDFVLPWVDDTDKEWQKDRKKWSKATIDCSGVNKAMQKDELDDSEERYRDWGLLKYWFRGVEKFCPWVRKIHFITYGHLPEWMDTQHPKLHIVHHSDYIPERYLPVFNSNVLESLLHKIHGISDKFVYFNDDIYLINDISPELFFKEGLPCDMLAFQPVIANPNNPVMSHILMNNMIVLAKHFSKRKNVLKQPGKYFKIGYPPRNFIYNLLEMAFPQYTGLYTVHGPSPFLKDTFTEVWREEEDILGNMMNNKFRCNTDMSQYLFREWQKLKGNFSAVNLHRYFSYFEINGNDHKLIRMITDQKKKIICINDTGKSFEFEKEKRELQNAFEKILPQKSLFEK